MRIHERPFTKKYISVSIIGKQRFWRGLVAGVVVAVITSLFANYLREMYRLFGILSENMLMMNEQAVLFFNYFFAALSSVFGLSVTVYIWLNRPFSLKKSRRERILSQFAQINAIVSIVLVLWLLVQFGTILSNLMFNREGYDNHLNLYEEFWYLFVLLIVYLFYQAWATVRLIYKSGKWILLSLLCCIVLTFILVQTTTVNQNKLNTVYLKRYADVHTYIDNELCRVKNEYNIEYDEKTIDALKKYYTESAFNLTHSLKSAFANEQKLSLDTIILQKIAIHTFKKSWDRNARYHWDYAYPVHIFNQIQLHDPNSVEAKELMLVLKEEIDLVNTFYSQEEMKDKTLTERKKSRYLQLNLNECGIAIPLIIIRDSLQRDERFSLPASNLPEVHEMFYLCPTFISIEKNSEFLKK